MRTTASAAALTAATAMGVAAATTLGAAWAAPAFAASVATLGAADVTGGTAYASGVVAATAMTAHADGGYITGSGTSRSDSILSWLSNGEYVVNASAASQNRDVLDAINDGASRERISTHFATQVNASSNGTQRPQMRVEVHNNGTGYVETQQVSDDHIRLIVHAEAPQLIAQHAPAIIASDIGNPNSKTSKALTRSTFSTRRR